MVEAMYEQSPEFFKKFRKNFKFFILNNESDVSQLPLKHKFCICNPLNSERVLRPIARQ